MSISSRLTRLEGALPQPEPADVICKTCGKPHTFGQSIVTWLEASEARREGREIQCLCRGCGCWYVHLRGQLNGIRNLPEDYLPEGLRPLKRELRGRGSPWELADSEIDELVDGSGT